MTHTMTKPRRPAARQWSLWTTRAATAAGLTIDAYVHLDLASVYAEAGGVINEGVLFRAEAVAALLAAAVIATGRRACYLAGLAVGGSALAGAIITGLAPRAQPRAGPPRP